MASVSIVRRMGDWHPVRNQVDLQWLGIHHNRQERQKGGSGYADSLNDINLSARSSIAKRLLREHHGRHQAKLPIRPELRFFDVVVSLGTQIHGDFSEAYDFAQATAKRNGPLVAAIRLPIGGDDLTRDATY
jgi:hypothetical protein